jgi:tRNA pseudouridine55 synthase
MNSVLSLYKPIGFTPLQMIALLKEQYPEYAKQTISYAGRLDPMADGLLLLLVNEENKKRHEYEALPKTYAFRVLLGVSTDTYDLLGKVQKTRKTQIFGESDNQMFRLSDTSGSLSFLSLLESFQGTHLQPYPPYSSRTVQGKPLYWWARNNRISEIEIPVKEIEIFDIRLLSQSQTSLNDLRLKINESTAKVSGDFRQEEILKTWNTWFTNQQTRQPVNQSTSKPVTSLPLLNCRVTCSSGTYVRSIAHEIGEKLGCGALAYSITRTHVGSYSLAEALRLRVPPLLPVPV